MLYAPYLQLYRKQVVKQADLVMALHVRGDAFTPEEKARNFAYYEELTVRDSSLSACTQAVIAAEVGHVELAYRYFGEAALMDLLDYENTTSDGIHIAALGGAWIAAVAGFGGMRDHNATLSFSPRLPQAITRLRFNLVYQGRRIRVEVGDHSVTYSLQDGEPLDITHHGKTVKLSADAPVLEEIPEISAPDEPHQPSGRAPHPRRRL
jgi:alpha,alpha-trehalose phosphorylase